MRSVEELTQQRDGWLSIARKCGLNWALKTDSGGLLTNAETMHSRFDTFCATLGSNTHMVLRRNNVLLWKEEADGAENLRHALPELLTHREREVVEELLEGRTAGEIAQVLEISHRTVEKHLEVVRKKLGVRGNSAIITLFST